MAPHVEDARDRLVAMNRPIPEASQEAVAENDAEERSRQALHFSDKTLGLIKHGPRSLKPSTLASRLLKTPSAHSLRHHQAERRHVQRGGQRWQATGASRERHHADWSQ